jgi:transcriptional regulator with XRE-family HTH domain
MHNELREARLRLGLTQKQLAEKFEIPINTIARWERGALRIKHQKLLSLALVALAVEVKEIGE